MRKVIIIVVSIAALLVLGLVSFVLFFDIDKYRSKIQAELQEKLNRPVTIGKVGLSLFPLAARLDNVSIGEAPTFASQPPFATAEKLYVSAGLFSLLRGQVAVKSLRVEKPQIHLIRNAEGVWSFSTLGRSSTPRSGTAPPANSAAPPETPAAAESSQQAGLSLDELRIIDGRIALTDMTPKKLSGIYDHIDLTVKDYAPNKRFSIDLGVHLPGEGKQLLAITAEIGPIPAGNPAATPVEGDLSLSEVSFSGLQKFLSLPIPQGTDTVASGKAKFNTVNGIYTVKGNLNLEKTKIQGTPFESAIEADYDLSHDPNRELLQIKSADVKLGRTPLSVSGDMDLRPTPAALNMHVSTKNASITEIAKIAGAVGVAFNPNYQIKGDITADVTAKGTTKQPALSGTLLAKDVQVSGGEIKQPVRVPQLNLALSPDAIRANSFTVSSGKTNLNAAFTLSQYTTPKSIIDASLKTDGASIPELLSIVKAYGMETAEGVTGSGALSLDVRVQGPLSQTKDLKYAGTGKLTNVVLNLPTLTKPVGFKNADIRFRDTDASLENLSASIGSSNFQGQLSVRDFAAPHLKFALSADKVNIDELSTLATKTAPKKSSASSATPFMPSSVVVAAGPAEPTMLEKLSGGGTIAIGTVIAQQMVLSGVKTTCAFNQGVINLSPLSSGIFGGQQTGSIALDMRPANPLVTLNVKFAGVNTNQLLSSMSTAKNVLTGSLSATTNGNFRLVSGDISPTLNGTVDLRITNGRIQNINILDQLSKVGKFLSNAPAQQQGGTNLKQFSGTLQIRSGVATTNNLVAVIDQGSLSAKGSINLATQGLNLHTNAVLDQGYSQVVGGSKIGGYLNTALANNRGELVLPVIITGTFAKPVFQPDVQALAQMKLNNLLPTTGDPAKMGSGLLNSILGGKKSGDADQQKQQPKPEDAIKSLFDRFKKKK